MKRLLSIILSASFLILISCQKESVSVSMLVSKVTDIGAHEFNFAGFYKDTTESIISCGVCWDVEHSPSVLKNKKVLIFQKDTFRCVVNELNENTVYYLRGFVETQKGFVYSEEISIKTLLNSSLPQVTTSSINSIQHVMAIGGGNVVTDGGNAIISKGLCWSVSPHPTIVDTLSGVYRPKFYSNAGKGSGAFSSNIICLLPKTKYYIRAYATNSLGTSYGNEIEFVTKAIEYGVLTDVEGNNYKTIQIGNQTWMAENLKTTKLNDGTSIKNVIDSKEWENLNSPAYCWYDQNINNKKDYGALYVWYTVSTDKLCPSGWQVASKSDWNTLIENLGDSTYAGIKLKESGSQHWVNAKVASDNSSGFGALPGGHRYRYGLFDLLGSKSNYWITDEANTNEAWYKDMNENGGEVGTWKQQKNVGYSVRCIKE